MLSRLADSEVLCNDYFVVTAYICCFRQFFCYLWLNYCKTSRFHVELARRVADLHPLLICEWYWCGDQLSICLLYVLADCLGRSRLEVSPTVALLVVRHPDRQSH